jgi:hypothetical protein
MLGAKQESCRFPVKQELLDVTRTRAAGVHSTLTVSGDDETPRLTPVHVASAAVRAM